MGGLSVAVAGELDEEEEEEEEEVRPFSLGMYPLNFESPKRVI
jgi:hypothetical protein